MASQWEVIFFVRSLLVLRVRLLAAPAFRAATVFGTNPTGVRWNSGLCSAVQRVTELERPQLPENETASESDMSDPKMVMEVPPQVRDFAVKSVDQAQRAISSFMESASKSVIMVPGPMSDVAKQTLEITEKNLKLSLDHARKLMHAKDISEVMQLQTEFLRNQFGLATEQSNQISGVSSAQDVAKEEPDLT